MSGLGKNRLIAGISLIVLVMLVSLDVSAQQSETEWSVTPPFGSRTTADTSPEPESPVLNVTLPVELSDATSAAALVVQTQNIIDATQIEVPPDASALQLMGVVQQSLQRNLDLQAARREPIIAGSRVSAEQSVFDPVAFANVTLSQSNVPTVGGFKYESDFYGSGGSGLGSVFGGGSGGGNGIGIQQKMPTGAQMMLQTSANWSGSASNVPGFEGFGAFEKYGTDVSFQVLQPLLQGFGVGVNLAAVRVAYNNRMISEEELRSWTIQTIQQAHRVYWSLVYARIDAAIRRQSLALAADLLRENLIRYKYGDTIAVEVYEAEAGVKLREQDVISAANALENSMDEIRELLAFDRSAPDWERPLVPVDPPVFYQVSIDEDASLEVALQRNPEIRIARLAVQNGCENLLVAQDSYKPQLDLSLGVSQSGRGDTMGDAYKLLGREDFTSWNAGLSYSLPIHRRRAQADIMSAQQQIQQAQINVQRTIQSVTYQHRRAVRNIETLVRQVIATKATVRAEKDRLEKQKIAHQQGITTSHDLLQVQEDYAQAQASVVQAIVNYYLALVEWESVRGTLPETLGFEFVAVR